MPMYRPGWTMIVSTFIWSLLKYVLAGDLRGGKIVKVQQTDFGYDKGKQIICETWP